MSRTPMPLNKKISIGVVGATGRVGEVFLSLLIERNFPFYQLRLFASQESVGKKYKINGKKYEIQVLKKNCFKGLDLVFFSSEDSLSLTWAPQALKEGAFVVDNSAAFRMNPSYPLIVPEINSNCLPSLDQDQNQVPSQASLITSPNCSTIQLVLLLHPLAKDFGLESVRLATYQAVSGAGRKGEKKLLLEIQEQVKSLLEEGKKRSPSVSIPKEGPFPHPIAFNCIPQIGSFNEEGFCGEEVKIMNETKKILHLPNLNISAFTVRIPSWNSHAEVVWVKFSKPVSQKEILEALEKSPSLSVMTQKSKDKNETNYPHPLNVSGTNKVFVGRIHKDSFDENTWIFWVVGDNLRKGAALNGIQIAETLFGLKSPSSDEYNRKNLKNSKSSNVLKRNYEVRLLKNNIKTRAQDLNENSSKNKASFSL